MNLSPNALSVLERRYFIRDEKQNLLEDAEGMFRRVADAVAKDDKALADRFYSLMTSFDFLPNSPTLMNAGRPLGQLSACFVLPVEDTLEGIFDAIKQAAMIHKSGGGTGFSFSRLRPAGGTVRSTGGVASGPVSFMKVFNAATEAVKQGGTRRGANMGVLRVDHPDIESFIQCKQDTGEITNFNLSVALTDAFLLAVRDDAMFDLISPRDRQPVRQVRARELYELIVNSAWNTGEPGVLFIDRVNRDNPVPAQGEIESTNPCGEQPLLPYESCNLGSINLKNMMRDGRVDWDKLSDTVGLAVLFLDNVIDVNKYPLDIIRETTLATRKIGLGVMGFADLLLELGIPYNSDEGVELGARIMSFISSRAQAESETLAGLRGTFPLYGQSVLKTPRRNATVTTIAPTGTLSLIAGVSSGIEPVFAFSYERHVMDGTILTELNPVLEKTLAQNGAAGLEDLPDDVRAAFVCAHDIAPVWHVKMQAAFQQHIDNAVSKTVNFPHGATVDQVRETYDLAYELGCKGVTIYRDGSRGNQVLVAKAPASASEQAPESDDPGCDDCALPRDRVIHPRERDKVARGITEKIVVGCGNLYITVNFDDIGVCEVFTNTGKKGGCPSQSEATARLATAALRSGVDPAYIIKQLRGIRCPSTVRQKGMECMSCPDAIARVIERVMREQYDYPQTPAPSVIENRALCPECGHNVAHEGGCVVCHHCGYSKCG